MYSEQIRKELNQVTLSCKFPPLPNLDHKDAAEYCLNKIRYFRQNGVPENHLYELESLLCINIPDYICENFDDFFKFLNYDVSAFFLAGERLCTLLDTEQKLITANKILTPLIHYLEKNYSELIETKFCFQDSFERYLFYLKNKGLEYSETNGNYTSIYVLYAKMLQLQYTFRKMAGDKPKAYLEESKRILDIAEKISPVNATVYIFMAKYYQEIGDDNFFHQNILKALYFIYRLNDDYGISHIYNILAMDYWKKDIKLCEALAVIESHYIDPMRSPVFFLLSKINKIKSTMDLEQACKLLKKSGIQVGFSDFVVDAAETFPKDKLSAKISDLLSTVLTDNKKINPKKKGFLSKLFG